MDRERERESRKSVLSAQLDDNDDLYHKLAIVNVQFPEWVETFFPLTDINVFGKRLAHAAYHTMTYEDIKLTKKNFC